MSTPSRKRRRFGALRKLPSGRWQASYIGPDGQRHICPGGTFDTRKDAESWLAAAQTAISNQDWRRPEPKHAQTFSEYADSWLADRELRAGTRDLYRKLLNRHLNPAFGGMTLDAITPVSVRTWHAGLAAVTGSTRQAHA